MTKSPGNGELGGACVTEVLGLSEGEGVGIHVIVFPPKGGDTLDLGMHRVACMWGRACV